MKWKWLTLPALLTALVLADGLSASAFASRGAEATTKTVAAVTTVDYRAVIVAERTSGGAAPTARLTVTAYQRIHARWLRVAGRPLAGTFFWKTITGPHSLCGLQLVTAATPSGSKLGLTVQPLVSPSLGCGHAQLVRFGTS